MSHTFYLYDVNNLDVDQVIQELSAFNPKFREGYPAPQNNTWPTGTTYIYQENVTCREPEVTYGPTAFEVRIMSACAVEDCRLALALVTAVAKQTNARIRPEDNDEMTLAEFSEQYGAQWIREHVRTTLGLTLSHVVDKPDSVLTVGNLQIGKRFVRQLLADKPKLVEEFFSRFRLVNYGSQQGLFHIASVFEATDKEQGKRVRFSAFAGEVPTLLPDKAHYVTLARPKVDETVDIHIDALADLMDGKGKWISEGWLLTPIYTDSEWQTLLQRVKTHHIQDVFQLGEDFDPEQEEPQGTLNELEWNALSCVPLVVFALVAAADGNIDADEVASFQNSVLRNVATENEALQRILMLAMSNFAPLMQGIMEQKLDPIVSLQAANDILDKHFEPQEAQAIKQAFYNIGKSVAEASGGLFGMFGSKISKSEKKALEAIAKLLNLKV